MIVVPKKKHDKIVAELKAINEGKTIEINTLRKQRDSYINAYEVSKERVDSTLEAKAKIERDKELMEISMKRKEETICKLEFKIEKLNEQLLNLQRPIIRAEESKCKINKYEYIAKRTKKTRTREKAYNKILEMRK